MSTPSKPKKTTGAETKKRLEPRWEVKITNLRTRRGFFWGTLRFIGFMFFLFTFAMLSIGALAYTYFSRNLPALPRDLARAHMHIPTEIYASDNTLIGEFAHAEDGRRFPLAYEKFPNLLLKAFIAAEDGEFFDHRGIDYAGIARAMVENVKAGRIVQGASTITQQAARTFLTRAKSFKRKIREAILARRIEDQFSKKEILTYYLNTIYLGHGASGVQAAALNYFRKNVWELNLAEIAMLAGMPQAPSEYSPLVNFKKAKYQQAKVLKRMLKEGFITQEQEREALQTKLKVYHRQDINRSVTPYFTEHVRRYLERKYGARNLYSEGLRVYTTVDPELQHHAHQAIVAGMLKLDRKQGYRGAHMKLPRSQWEDFIKRCSDKYGDLAATGLEKERIYLGLITRITAKKMWVKVANLEGMITLYSASWAKKPDNVRFYTHGRLHSLNHAFREGDVIDVKYREPPKKKKRRKKKKANEAEEKPPTYFTLYQDPKVRSAIYSIDPQSGYVRAAVGGYDYATDSLNRAVQSCRPPGSVFKGIYYSAALEKGLTVGSPILDVPKNEYDPIRKTNWKPANYDGKYHGQVLVKTALVASMNNPSIRVFEYVGITDAIKWARKLGIRTPLHADKSTALGSSCVMLNQITNAYATFDLMGLKPEQKYIRKITDRYGNVLLDQSVYWDIHLEPADRIDRMFQNIFHEKERVMTPQTAWLMVYMLKAVATYGTGYKARYLKKPVAGKTGTTNNAFDAWFVGFTKNLATGVWIGHDRNDRALGIMETGGHTACPIWLNYMKKALKTRPQGGWPKVADIVTRTIDTRSGLLGPGVSLPFAKGTEPKERARRKGVVDPRDFMQVNF